MLKNKIQKVYLKIKDQWWFFIAASIIIPILSRIINKIKISDISDIYFFGIRIVSAPLYKATVLLLELLKTKVNLFSILSGLLLSLLLIRVYKRYFIFNKRGLRIIDAWYGKNDQKINITRELNNSIVGDKLKIVLSNNIAGDPVFGIEKEGVVNYIHNKNRLEKKYKENEVIDLP